MRPSFLSASLVVLLSIASVTEQSTSTVLQGCAPPAPPTWTQPNIFTEEQDAILGDFLTDEIARSFHVIDDEALTAHLRMVGQRLLAHMPPTTLRWQFFVVDLPEANAFSIAGGRIYVSRKIVAQTHSEDELAGLLAHEMGHIYARQTSTVVTRQLQAVLHVSALGDRRDIYAKMNELLDNAGRKPELFRADEGRENADQTAADRLGLYALSASGYDPSALETLFDRTSDARGRTGNLLTDLFGTTSADSKRLRDLQKQAGTVAAACIDTKPGPGDYASWRTSVVAYTGLGRKTSLHGVELRLPLPQPLAPEITNLRFSSDGRFVLAQDDAGITVLTRSPFQPVFRIDAPDAEDAMFTPDSTRVAYTTPGLRVEVWSVADQKLDAAYEVFSHRQCAQSLLAPDAATVACLDEDLTLSLLDVATGRELFTRPHFYDVAGLETDVFGLFFANLVGAGDHSGLIRMAFSPDARYFVAGHRGVAGGALGTFLQNSAVVFDVAQKAPAKIKVDADSYVAAGVVFDGPNKLVGFGGYPIGAGVVTLPGGAVQRPPVEYAVVAGDFSSATKGDYLFVRPFSQYAVGVYDLKQGKVIQGSSNAAIDIYDDQFVSERGTGDLGLYAMGTNQLVAQTSLPRSGLGNLRTIALAPDFSRLAISERTRGAIWDLGAKTLVGQMRGFRGGYFDPTGIFYADVPRAGTDPRQLMRIDTNARSGGIVTPIADARADQFGPYLVAKKQNKPTEKPAGAIVYDVRDATTGKTLWTRTFTDEDPSFGLTPSDRTVLLAWPIGGPAAKAAAHADADLAKRIDAMGSGASGLLLEVDDAQTGARQHTLVIDTHRQSFGVRHGGKAGDWLWLADTNNRVLLYSIATGDPKGHVFGDRASIAPAGGVMSVENGPSRLVVYDLSTLRVRDDFTFDQAILTSKMSADGRKVFVLTADQTAYVLDVSSAGAGAAH